MVARKSRGMDLWMLRALILIGVCSVHGGGKCGAELLETHLESSNALVPALFVFGDSVLDAGTNSLFPSLLQANFKPYGRLYFRRPTGRFTNGRTYADFFAQTLGLPFPEPYLTGKVGWSVMQGVNYASAGSGILRTTNAVNQIIPFPDQFLQFEQTKISITQTLNSALAAERLLSKSLFLINIGGNDIAVFDGSQPIERYVKNLMVVIEEAVGKLYKAGARKVVLVGVGPVGCVPGVLVAHQVSDGTCLEWVNDQTKLFNAALEDLVLNRFPEVFKGIKAIVGKPYETLYGFVHNGSGFTQGVKACCGSGLYNAEFQCGRPSDLIKNPPFNVCDNAYEYAFWDYFHPTERAYRLMAEKFWAGGPDVIVPMNLKALVSS